MIRIGDLILHDWWLLAYAALFIAARILSLLMLPDRRRYQRREGVSSFDYAGLDHRSGSDRRIKQPVHVDVRT